MSDLINRQDALEMKFSQGINEDGKLYVPYSEVMNNIRQLPSTERKGKWIRNDNGTYSCSICQSWIPEEQHHYARYCLYCGARMKGEQNERHD